MTDYFHLLLNKNEIGRHSTLALAYIGDAVYEMLARSHVLLMAPSAVKALHDKTTSIVSAEAQCRSLKLIAPHLTEEEAEIVKRGRNTQAGAVRKNTDRATYQQATGLETLFGYLYLGGEKERIMELFAIIIGGAEQ